VVGVRLIALEAVREGGGLTTLTLAQYKALATLHVVIIFFLLWSFASNETRDGMSRRGGRVMLVKMGNEVGADSSMGEMMLGV
jgi:hypothetical protein